MLHPQQESSYFKLYPMGDSAIVVEFGKVLSPSVHARVMSFANSLEVNPVYGIIEFVPAFTTITIYYDPWIVSKGGKQDAYETMSVITHTLLTTLKSTTNTSYRIVDIPVCYGGKSGPDLSFVASHSGLSDEEVIAIHTAGDYKVYMIGFAPGFPYLGGMDTRISAPRKDTPRTLIPAGSVGIAGMQTGIYPIETPGGWQLIGRTPIALFDPVRENPSLLNAGDKVRFILIGLKEYEQKKQNGY